MPDPTHSARALTADARRLLAVAWRLDRRRVVMQLVLLALTGLTGGAALLLLIPIVDSLASPDQAPMSVPLLGAVDLGAWPLPALLAAVIAAAIAQAAITRASTVSSVVLQQTVVDRLRGEAFAAILRAEWAFVLDRRRSDIIEVVTTGAMRSGMALTQMLQGAVTTVTALVTAAVALAVSPALAGVAIVGTLVLGVVLFTSIGPAHRQGRLFGERNRELQAVMTESMDSLRLVRAHDAGEVWRTDLDHAFRAAREVQFVNARRTSLVSAVASVGLVVSAAMLVLLAVALGVPGPTIVVVLLLVARLARNVQSLATTGQLLANALPAVRDIEDLTAAARAAAEHDGAETVIDLTDPFGAGPIVEFRDVSFHYAQGGNGVDHLDLVLPTGRATVITGPSGAGKSTTADLVLGLLRPDSGEILVGGSPLTPDRLRAWRSRVSYVPQETLLVPSSLRANLVWSVGRDVSDEECWDALHRAAASFARALPDGLDTRLGDRGIRLSGGERQRVAIARALLRRPALMVLDEATSSLDELTEAAVLDLVRSLTGSVTLLLIAHRRSTIEMADRVVRLDGGRRVPDANAGVP